MHNILIVEDHKEQNDELYKGIHQAYPNWNISSAYSLEDAKEFLSSSLNTNKLYSIFLLDVQLKDDPCDFGGFVLANEIRSQKNYNTVPILFLTSISDQISYALNNFHCYSYITKPYSIDDILCQIQQMMLTGFLEENCINVTDTYRIRHRIIQKDIYYVEAKSHMISIQTLNGRISSRELSFEALKETLAENFIQCHKKYIINLEHIANYDRQNRYIQLGTHSIPVSRTYKNSLENTLCIRDLLKD
ncbi:MAG: LytTR family DNA-binding domain-containing protein [Clostridiales bacterium]|nr:LytTR family DNA-binding domain-containing protein [Clostridiales bacterium]